MCLPLPSHRHEDVEPIWSGKDLGVLFLSFIWSTGIFGDWSACERVDVSFLTQTHCCLFNSEPARGLNIFWTFSRNLLRHLPYVTQGNHMLESLVTCTVCNVEHFERLLLATISRWLKSICAICCKTKIHLDVCDKTKCRDFSCYPGFHESLCIDCLPQVSCLLCFSLSTGYF